MSTVHKFSVHEVFPGARACYYPSLDHYIHCMMLRKSIARDFTIHAAIPSYSFAFFNSPLGSDHKATNTSPLAAQ